MLFRFSADQLGDGPPGIFLQTFKIMDYLPVLKPIEQLRRFQKMIGIMRAAVKGLLAGKGLIDQNPTRFYSFFNIRYQRAMEVAENQNGPVLVVFQWILTGFQIDFPKNYLESFPFCRFLGLSQ